MSTSLLNSKTMLLKGFKAVPLKYGIVKWSMAFTVALIGHAAIAINFTSTSRPMMEQASGTPVTIIGSLAALSESTLQEEIKGEYETASEKPEPELISKESPAISSEEPTETLTPAPISKAVNEKPIETTQPLQKKQPVKKPVKKPAKKLKPKKSRKQIARKASRANAALRKGGGARGVKKYRAGAARRANYSGRIQAHLARHKRRANGRGRAVVSFSISKSGRVTSVRLARRSGNAAVDRAALAMVRSASPFPPIPKGMKSRMSFTVPVRYK